MLWIDTLGFVLKNKILLSYKSAEALMVVGFLVGLAVGRLYGGSCSSEVLVEEQMSKRLFLWYWANVCRHTTLFLHSFCPALGVWGGVRN